jgi:hypothetical protein
MKMLLLMQNFILICGLQSMSQPSQAQTVSQRLEDIERHLRTDASNQNLERFDHNYVFNRHELDRVTDTYFKHVPYDGALVLAYFRMVENQPLIFAVYENYEKSGVDLFGGDSLLGHTVYLRLFEKERPIVKSWVAKGDFVLFKLIQDTFDKVSNATPSGQSMNWGPTSHDQRLLFVAALHENGSRKGDLHGAMSIDPPQGSQVSSLLRRLDSFCNLLLEGRRGPADISDKIVLSK